MSLKHFTLTIFFRQQKLLAETQDRLAAEDERALDQHYNEDIAERLRKLRLNIGEDAAAELAQAEEDKVAEAKKRADNLKVTGASY